MTEWDGKCSRCGTQIMGTDRELHYDLEEPGSPAYCKECYELKEKQRIHNTLLESKELLFISVLCLILLVLWRVIH
jgi:hypothetical protein